MSPVEVIGCNGSGFSGEAQSILRKATLLFGSRRLLAVAKAELKDNCKCVALDANLTETLAVELPKRARRRTVILASGDPLYYGIGGTLKRLGLGAELRYTPAPTAFQELFSRLGEPWENANFCSLHGERNALPFRSMLRSRIAVVYGDAARTARKIAAELIGRLPETATRNAAAGCNLGLPDEYIVRGTLGSIAADVSADSSLSVLALLPDGRTEIPAFPLGLEDACYRHGKNMITHPEVRAIVVSKLRPTPGVLWDLGAGSGSVGLEASGVCGEMELYAVERNIERFSELEENFKHEGLRRSHAVFGDSLEVLAGLPAPDRVFIGGGGRDLEPIILESFARLNPGGILVVTAVLAESVATLYRVLLLERTELLTVNISRGTPLGGQTLLRAENPITIAVFRKGGAR